MSDGKLHDVLVDDSLTGFTVWANLGMTEIITAVPGVTFCNDELPTRYTVHLDLRYDPEWIRQEIIARIKIA